MMRARARTALIGVVLLLLVFLVARRLGEEDRAAPGEGSNNEVAGELPSDPPIDGERRSLVPDWEASELGEGKDSLAPRSEEGSDDETDPTDPPRRTRAEAREGELVDVRGDRRGGRLEGRVTYEGPIPEPELLDMAKDPKCTTLAPEPEQRKQHKIRIDDKGGLAGAVVWVELPEGTAHPPSEKPVELHQKNCRFEPETIAIQIGQTFQVFNDDPTLHNVHAIVKRSEFNQAMPKQGMRLEKLFKAKDLEGTLACEVHPWMKGRIYVFDHPFFAVTDASGKFLIDRLPGDGPYHLIVQHPHAGTKELAAKPGTIEVHLHETNL